MNQTENTSFAKPNTLLTAEVGYKPFRYPWAYEIWLQQQQMHWLAAEVTMGDDISDWNVLNEAERHLITQVLRFFTQADSDVATICYLKYLKFFKPTEVVMMLLCIANTETIHMDAYSHLLESLGLPQVEYKAFLKFEEMLTKHEFLFKFNMNSPHEVAKTLAVYGAFTEGLQLFASFAMLINFQRFGKMKGLGQIVAWSIRDELLHTEAMIMLFHQFIEEYPEAWTKKLHTEITEACINVVKNEDAFIDLAFGIVKEVQGLSASDMRQYIRFIANTRTKQLRIEPPFPEVTVNPLMWMDEIVVAPQFTNFFEQRPTAQYGRAATSESWEDVF
ncbi:ribonucleotide-diphosphate reductase subunit beta [Candidatus Fokinia crypta]|uniref:Ribonucleoside-diphosphate reductase subunit beta n=1 Tax=Candidatus Fokinia crypta TaxID=1920990 RepID=A0ABZ0UND7_9RICK|nr:ribonucleotide-diphosphate reductase subunit beta [Candidatus Fokinia cryptica]WPX97645.1 Ribonucleoside-diphosphate reductase subunit beta [Candidatus Fokinia cryptica]